MAHASTYKPGNGFTKWLDDRLPLLRMMHDQFNDFPTPRNLNYLWTFGGILTFFLTVQLLTGIVLAMHYVPHESMAFDSVEHIMRNVNWGWLIRYMHANGASMFFLAVYIHIFRGMYYGSYKSPREVLWIIGVLIFLVMMATAFMGYSLVWGQMSFWAVTVITNLFSSLDAIIPGLGTTIVQWIWGGFSVGNPTLNRLYSLHYLLPFVIAGLVMLHIWALHIPGNNNPTGVPIRSKSDAVPFHPYYTLKDSFALVLFVILFAGLVFYAPNFLGHPDNYIEANPLLTPAHIVPEWYFLPFYAILRAIPNKLLGVIAMFSSIGLLLFLPWLDTSKVRSARYRPIYKWCFLLFVISGVALGYLGSKPPEGAYVVFARIFTAYYFLHLLVILPALGWIEKPKTPPNSITEDVLRKKPGLLKTATATASALLMAIALFSPPRALAAEAPEVEAQEWSFSGPFGTFDRGQLQRGYKVYKEVCASCHAMRLLSFRNLGEPGGPEFSEGAVKALAASVEVTDGPDADGEMFSRPGRPSDRFPSPYANEQQARAANSGTLPPDLSVIAKARAGGPDYLYALLTGYTEKPENVQLTEGMNYNAAFPGHQIAMPPPLSAEQVEYTDGTAPTVQNYSKDVSAFLMWAAEPKLELRHKVGFRMMIYLVLLAGFLYLAKRRVWAGVKH